MHKDTRFCQGSRGCAATDRSAWITDCGWLGISIGCFHEFPERTFSLEVTNYLYTIVEVPGADPNITYDPAVYTVKVTTRAVHGQLIPTIQVEKDGVLTGEGITFTNHRKVPSTGDNTPLTIALVLSAALALGYVALMLCRRKMS